MHHFVLVQLFERKINFGCFCYVSDYLLSYIKEFAIYWMATSFSQASPEGASCSYEEEILKEFNFEEHDSNTPPFWIKRGRRVKHDSFSSVESSSSADSPLSESPKTDMPSVPKRDSKKRGRKPSHLDTEAKLERSRQSARECRARKKLRYQHLDDTVSSKEDEVSKLWQELDMVRTRSCKIQAFFSVHLVELDLPGQRSNVIVFINAC